MSDHAASTKTNLAIAREISVRRRWLIASVLMTLVITGYLDRISVAVLFTNPNFQKAIGIGFDAARLGMLMTVFFIAYGLSSLLLGFTGDRFGPHKMLVSGSLIWGALMLLMGGATSFLFMLLSRILLGIAEGPQFGWILKVVTAWFPPKEHGRANSIWLLGSPLGSAIGFPLMIFLVSKFGWREAFYFLAVLNILFIAPLLWVIVAEKPSSNNVPMYKGKALNPKTIWIDSQAFLRNKDFWFLTAFDCGELIYLWGLNSWLPTYLQRTRHLDVQHLGVYSSLPFILLFLGEILSGWLSDRLKRKAPLLLIGLGGAAVLLYCATIASSPISAALLIAASAGFFGLCVPATYVLAMKVIPSEVASSGIGVMNGIANTIGAFAPFAMGIVIASTKSVDAGLYVLVAGALLCSLAVIPMLGRH